MSLSCSSRLSMSATCSLPSGVDVQFAERTVEGVADLAVQNVDGQGVAPDHFGDHRW